MTYVREHTTRSLTLRIKHINSELGAGQKAAANKNVVKCFLKQLLPSVELRYAMDEPLEN